jgi:CheY-like chemotaxis protein
MTSAPSDLLTPRILVVDDERQIHASLRLRLARDYDLVCCTDPRQALNEVQKEKFDLCFVDIHMPHMNGLAFIEQAQMADGALGYVVLSAFDSDHNLRRTIPLGVYDFISKPLPARDGFEARVPGWIEQTRRRRRERTLAAEAAAIADDRDSARLEKEVELVASETARDALLQTANLLTTIQALLVTATTTTAARAKTEPGLTALLRILEEARKTADASMTVAEGFFDSAYGNRDTSPALVNEGVRHAINIATRMGCSDTMNKAVDFHPTDERRPLHGVSGIGFLLMMVPVIGVALASMPPSTTLGIWSESVSRLDALGKDTRFRNFEWLNRKHALNSHNGVLLMLTSAGPPLARGQIEAWLKGDYAPLADLTPRGLVAGLQKSHGMLGVAVAPQEERFHLLLALPI